MIGGTVPPQRLERALVGDSKIKNLSEERETPFFASPHSCAHFALDRAEAVIDGPLQEMLSLDSRNDPHGELSPSFPPHVDSRYSPRPLGGFEAYKEVP